MPEKQAHQVLRALREQYEKGATAVQRENYDYAISILSAVLDKEPGFLECREFLRVAQHKKAASQKGFFKKAFTGVSTSGLIAKGQLALRRSSAEALSVAEQILSADPNSTSGHRLLIEAALEAVNARLQEQDAKIQRVCTQMEMRSTDARTPVVESR